MLPTNLTAELLPATAAPTEWPRVAGAPPSNTCRAEAALAAAAAAASAGSAIQKPLELTANACQRQVQAAAQQGGMVRRASPWLKGAGWQSGQAHLSNACLTVSTSASGGTRRGPRPTRSQPLTCLKTEPSRKPDLPLWPGLARRGLQLPASIQPSPHLPRLAGFPSRRHKKACRATATCPIRGASSLAVAVPTRTDPAIVKCRLFLAVCAIRFARRVLVSFHASQFSPVVCVCGYAHVVMCDGAMATRVYRE